MQIHDGPSTFSRLPPPRRKDGAHWKIVGGHKSQSGMNIIEKRRVEEVGREEGWEEGRQARWGGQVVAFIYLRDQSSLLLFSTIQTVRGNWPHAARPASHFIRLQPAPALPF